VGTRGQLQRHDERPGVHAAVACRLIEKCTDSKYGLLSVGEGKVRKTVTADEIVDEKEVQRKENNYRMASPTETAHSVHETKVTLCPPKKLHNVKRHNLFWCMAVGYLQQT